jgi:hypothetical protein
LDARDKASAKFRDVGNSANQLGRTIRNIGLAIGGYLSVRSLVSFGKSSVEAFAESEVAGNHLKAALESLGKDASDSFDGLKDFASQLQNITTEEDDATIETMSLGASLGGLSGNELKAATIAAIGFSRSLKIDTQSAMMMISKAAQGNTAAFGRYGVVLDDSMTKGEKFEEILRRGADGFSIARAETETYAGKVEMLKNKWGDVKEMLGEVIYSHLPDMDRALALAQTVMEDFGDSWKLVVAEMKLGVVSFWEEFKTTWTKNVPELLSWTQRQVESPKAAKWVAEQIDNWMDPKTGPYKRKPGDKYEPLAPYISTAPPPALPNLVAPTESEETKKLRAEVTAMRKDFADKMQRNLQAIKDKSSFDAKAVVAAADLSKIGKKEQEKSQSSKIIARLEANESRFLTFAPGQKFDKVERNTAQSNKLLENNNRLLAAIKGGIDRMQVGRYELEGFGLT